MWHPLYTFTNNPDAVIPPVVVTATGTGGIDPVRKKSRGIVKPTGLSGKKKDIISARTEDIHEEAVQIAESLNKEFLLGKSRVQEDTAAQIALSSLNSEILVNPEIGILLKKKLVAQEEEDIMLLMLLAANS